MKAFAIRSYGGPEVGQLVELPDPREPGAGQVLVEVQATSLNPLDVKIRSGAFALFTGRTFPKVLGADFAGVVRAVGRGVTAVHAGEAVYGFIPIYLRKQGAHAQLVTVPVKSVRRLPQGLSVEQAAALPVAALTALNGLRQCGPLKGRRILVVGATGGVGHFAVQLAVAGEATVTAVCSGRNAERARALGARTVVDYAQEDVTQRPERYDIVFDAHGGFGWRAAKGVLVPGGTYATTVATPLLLALAPLIRLTGGPRVVPANMRDKPEDYAELERLLARRAVVPLVGAEYPLEQASEAFAVLERGGLVGKVVLKTA